MSENNSKNHYSSATHRRTQRSSTLNRKYVQRPEAQRKSSSKPKKVVIESTDLSEEMTSTPEISSFAICKAENMRRRQELADKINHERLAALNQKKVTVEPKEDPTPVHLVDLKETGKTKVHKPEIAAKAVQVRKTIKPTPDLPATTHPLQKSASAKLSSTWAPMPTKQPSARQLKDEAIQKAMRSVATMDTKTAKAEKVSRKQRHQKHLTKRVALGLACAAAVVIAIGAFISLNLPSISTYVTAMRTGISNPYPASLYVPRGYKLATSSAGENSVILVFSDNEGHEYTLTEEKSSWDSRALVMNYVSPKWSAYDTVKEQGLTIYIFGSSAAWVNGGVKYTIDATAGTLTNKQIKNIATSL